MMKILYVILLTALSGCVDFGLVGMHPELRTTYFEGLKKEVTDCLISETFSNNLVMQQDDSLPDDTYRYNILNPGGVTVAWVDISSFSKHQTAVSFYYAPESPDIHKIVTSIIEKCKKVY